MKAHHITVGKDKNSLWNKTLSIDEGLDASQYLLEPAITHEGRKRSPSKFKINFERSRASSE